MVPSNWFLYLWIAIAVITFFYLLFFKVAPYGRHSKTTWGPMIRNRYGWMLMETPAVVLFLLFFFLANPTFSVPTAIFVGLWLLHYLNRSFVYPFRIKDQGKKMPVVIMFSAIFFNTINTYIVGSYIGASSSSYDISWLLTPQFIIGITLFFVGFIMNQWADTILINLRKPGETGYKIPQGWLFRYISCPNLLGEIIEWIGFFILTYSLPTATFAIWTFANLAPRAIAHHKWYLSKFEDYPKERKALGIF